MKKKEKPRVRAAFLISGETTMRKCRHEAWDYKSRGFSVPAAAEESANPTFSAPFCCEVCAAAAKLFLATPMRPFAR